MIAVKLLVTTAIALCACEPALGQTGGTTSTQNAPSNGQPGEVTTPQDATERAGDIIVTAQRQSQRLQDVPIAVSAFTAENLERQQIVNPTALQQSLPSITFTKTNFTGSSFTIRGVGDLCAGATCDSATAVHVNDMPILNTRLFESEFFDLERVEVLRGPQGTLYGRNATAGVINFITAKPDLSAIHAAGEFEYGNYDSKRARAMINLPITDKLGIRIAGTYLKRGGYTNNLYTGNRIDGRNLYAVRGTLSWEPSSDTRLDLTGYYFHEKDNRSRIQKQLCHRDPTGILGCLPDRRGTETVNSNATINSVIGSREFYGVVFGPALAPFAIGSIYGIDQFAGVVNPADVRTVSVDYEPTYFADEEQYTAKLFHDFGRLSFNFTGGYSRNSVDSTSDYNLAVERPFTNNPGLLTLQNAGAASTSPFFNLRRYLVPNGVNGGVCQSSADPNGVGVYGGNSVGCYPQSLDFDRSTAQYRQYSAEAHVDSKFDGPFNFLLGAIYFDWKAQQDYYVSGFSADYLAGIIGTARTIAQGGTSFAAPPFFRTNTDRLTLKSYGLFGETYFAATDRLKLTVGLRYNHDRKAVRARTTFINVILPFGAASATDALNAGTVDFNPAIPGNQPFAETTVSYSRLTGRAVLDYKLSRDNLLYASYSRGYKSGGINAPVLPEFNVPTTFGPESVDAFEIGSKNTFGNGALRLNLTAFYYRYKGLQLSRLVARTSVNDNIDAHIYGVEAEAVLSPTPAFVVNLNFSYLKTKVAGDRLLVNPRDPSGGRSDTVIIKDISNASNCAVVPLTAGNAAGTNGFVAAVNTGLGLRAPVPVPATSTTGAYSICAALSGAAANPSVPLRTLFATLTGALPFSVLDTGAPVNIGGNSLPNAPRYKVAIGAQYTVDLGGSGWTVVPRADLNYTGDSTGTVFNLPVDRIQGYEVVNAQIQANAPGERFYARAFVQNLTANDATTGLYVTDQSSGLFSNIFTIEPRRYGVAVGFKF